MPKDAVIAMLKTHSLFHSVSHSQSTIQVLDLFHVHTPRINVLQSFDHDFKNSTRLIHSAHTAHKHISMYSMFACCLPIFI